VTARRIWLLPPALVLAAALWYGLAASRTPHRQPPLAAMDLDAFRGEFNRDAGVTRVILLLSPTRPICLRGAPAVQRSCRRTPDCR